MRGVKKAALALVLVACGTEEPRRVEPPQPADPAPSPAPPRGPTCDGRKAALDARVAEIASRHAACRYDVECVAAGVTSDCYTPCGVAIHPRGVADLEALAIDCPAYREAGCAPVHVECARWMPACRDGACTAIHDDPRGDDAPPPVPADNAPDLAEPPPRPTAEAAQEKAARLFDAIVHDDPRRAQDFFLPREPFLRIKAIPDPGAYWDRLFARYLDDVHALHEHTPDLDRARFDRLEIVRRGEWMPVRGEGNALPYWVSRHSRLHYTVGGAPRGLEVRVLITWDGQWWITHLSEFH